MSDKDSKLRQLAASQGNFELRINESFDEVSMASLFAADKTTTTGLTWGYRGGRWSGTLIDNGTASLTASETNYIVATIDTGVVSVSTSDTNWNSGLYVRLYKVTTGAATITDYEDHRAGIRGIYSVRRDGIAVAIGDETSSLVAGAGKVTFRMPYALKVTEIRGSVSAAATGATLLTVDVNANGSSILSTKLTFDASEKTTLTAATPAVISDPYLDDNEEITIDIDAVGNTIAGAGLKLYILGLRA